MVLVILIAMGNEYGLWCEGLERLIGWWCVCFLHCWSSCLLSYM